MELELPFSQPPPTRGELRAICDAHATKDEIVRALAGRDRATPRARVRVGAAGGMWRDPPAERAHHPPRPHPHDHRGEPGPPRRSRLPRRRRHPRGSARYHGAPRRHRPRGLGDPAAVRPRPARRREVEPARPRARDRAVGFGRRRRGGGFAAGLIHVPAHGQRQPQRAPVVHPLRRRRLRRLLGASATAIRCPASATRGALTPATVC